MGEYSYKVTEDKIEVTAYRATLQENAYVKDVVAVIPKEAFVEAYNKWIVGSEGE